MAQTISQCFYFQHIFTVFKFHSSIGMSMQISLRVLMGGLLASPPWLCSCWSPFNRCSIQSIYNTHKITLKYLFMYFTIRIVDIQILNGFLHHNEIQLLAIIAIFAHTVGGAPCFRIGGAEDNFIIYIEYCFFFVPMMKSR